MLLRRIPKTCIVLGFITAHIVVAGNVMTRKEERVWRNLYGKIHPGQSPPIISKRDLRDWIISEQPVAEPILLQILRGEDDNTLWTDALPAAYCIPTPQIRDVLISRIEDMGVQSGAIPNSFQESDRGLLLNILEVLAEGNDNRALPALNTLSETLDESPYSHITARKLFRALAKIGDRSSLKSLAQMPARKGNEGINREAALTEKIIEARIKGEKVSPNAEEELRQLSQRFLRAIEKRDREEFVSVFPFGFRDGIDDGDFQEWLENKDIGPALKGLARAMEENARFDIDEEKLTASLDLPEGYRVEYVYEVDGWKVANIRPTREPQREKPDR